MKCNVTSLSVGEHVTMQHVEMRCIIYCIGGHAEWTRTTVPPISSSATLGQPSYYTFLFIFVIFSIITCWVWFGHVFVFVIIITLHIYHPSSLHLISSQHQGFRMFPESVPQRRQVKNIKLWLIITLICSYSFPEREVHTSYVWQRFNYKMVIRFENLKWKEFPKWKHLV